MAKNPGRVVTEDVLASLVGEAFGQSHTPLNILSGFKKTGIYPFNPGEIRDRQLAPSLPLRKQTPQVPTFSQEQVSLFEVHYKEGYDVEDATYLQWKNIYHPEATSTVSSSSVSAVVSSSPGAASVRCSPQSVCSSTTSSDLGITSSMVSTSGCAKTTPSESPSNSVLDELLVLPQAMPSTSKRRKAINHKAKEVTDLSVLQDMKDKAQAEEEAKRIKEEKRLCKAKPHQGSQHTQNLSSSSSSLNARTKHCPSSTSI